MYIKQLKKVVVHRRKITNEITLRQLLTMFLEVSLKPAKELIHLHLYHVAIRNNRVRGDR